LFDHRSPQIFTENVESDQEKSIKSVKSVVEMAYFSAESILVRLQDKEKKERPAEANRLSCFYLFDLRRSAFSAQSAFY